MGRKGSPLWATRPSSGIVPQQGAIARLLPGVAGDAEPSERVGYDVTVSWGMFFGPEAPGRIPLQPA
jgi:hypothetical protein